VAEGQEIAGFGEVHMAGQAKQAGITWTALEGSSMPCLRLRQGPFDSPTEGLLERRPEGQWPQERLCRPGQCRTGGCGGKKSCQI
jgi:hypothetical protein